MKIKLKRKIIIKILKKIYFHSMVYGAKKNYFLKKKIKII